MNQYTILWMCDGSFIAMRIKRDGSALGWRDSNGNNIFDIIDFLPTTMLNDYYPDPASDNTPTYTGRATTTDTYPNDNPFEVYHVSSGNNITIIKLGQLCIELTMVIG